MNKSRPVFTRKLKHWMIYPKFQMRLIIWNLLIMSMAFGIVGIGVCQTFSYLKGLGTAVGLPNGHNYFQFIQLQSSVFFRNLAIAGALCGIASFMITLIVSHRLAGPMTRLRTYFAEIKSSGQVQDPLKFRKDDYMLELADEINSALENLKK